MAEIAEDKTQQDHSLDNNGTYKAINKVTEQIKSILVLNTIKPETNVAAQKMLHEFDQAITTWKKEREMCANRKDKTPDNEADINKIDSKFATASRAIVHRHRPKLIAEPDFWNQIKLALNHFTKVHGKFRLFDKPKLTTFGKDQEILGNLASIGSKSSKQ